MLKTTWLPNRLASKKNYYAKPVFKKNNNNNKVDKFSIGSSIEFIKKSKNQKIKNCLSPKNS